MKNIREYRDLKSFRKRKGYAMNEEERQKVLYTFGSMWRPDMDIRRMPGLVRCWKN